MSSSSSSVLEMGGILNDVKKPLKERFRALFGLKSVGGPAAVEQISRALDDESALLKHEVAYCLGQMGDPEAVPVLEAVLQDVKREAIVRHEAGEALAAIVGRDDAGLTQAEAQARRLMELLERFSADPVAEVAETCQLAVQRIHFYRSGQADREKATWPANPYESVDPAPPFEKDRPVEELKRILLDEQKASLFERYRAMFTLRNIGGPDCVEALSQAMKCSGALFRHEIAYVLGQMQSPLSKESLFDRLRDPQESDMVRHECAEALGNIESGDINDELKKYLGKDVPAVLRESCEVALDIASYNQNSDDFAPVGQHATSVVN